MADDFYQNLRSFYSEFLYRRKIASGVRSSLNRYLALDFNLVRLFVSREEDLSRLLAVLLDPNAGHGQDSLFLSKFLEHLGLELPVDLMKTEVKTEAYTSSGRRIDVLLEFENGFRLGIENKPWAQDQENQLVDYVSFLMTGGKRKFLLLFLGGNRKEPSSLSLDPERRNELENSGLFRAITYRDFLLPWLEESAKEVEAEKVRWLLRDFKAWIEENFT